MSKERDYSLLALPETAAPRLVRVLQILGLVTTAAGVAKIRMGHAYRIRGLSLAAGAITTSGSVTLKVGGATIIAPAFVASDATYVPLSQPVDVDPGQLVELDVASTGLNDAQVDLDTIP